MVHKRSFKMNVSGFTIIELLVTIAIVVLVTGIVMIRYSSFNSSVLLTSQAYLTAFDVREAQSLAISVRGNADEFREEYGLYFNMATPDQYILFQDDDANGEDDPAQYDEGEAVGAPYRVDARFEISNICATNTSSRTCYKDDPTTTTETVDPSLANLAISFKRPDFDAKFYSTGKSNIIAAEIHFANDESAFVKKVVVYGSGQISVE